MYSKEDICHVKKSSLELVSSTEKYFLGQRSLSCMNQRLVQTYSLRGSYIAYSSFFFFSFLLGILVS